MRDVFWAALLLCAFSVLLSAQPKPELKKMSPSELATFTHDLQHDLVNWQARINQYRSDLNPSYRMDSVVLQNFELLDQDIKLLEVQIKELSGKDSLANDVSVYSSLETVASGLNGISSLSADASTMDTLASSKLRDVGMICANTVMDVRKEIQQYLLRFYDHTVASAILADEMLKAGCSPAKPKDTTK